MEQNDRNQLFLWHQSVKDKNQVLSFASNNLSFKLVSRLTDLKFTIKELLRTETSDTFPKPLTPPKKSIKWIFETIYYKKYFSFQKQIAN